jgi:hypothetical protein
MLKNTNARQSKLFAGLAGAAVLALLTGCAADDSAEQPPADQQVEEQPTQTDESPQETTDAETQDETDQGDDTATSTDDPVYDVIDAVEAEYSGGFIVDIDRDDDGDSQFDVDVVVDNELLELEVTADGNITVDDQEGDDDKIAKADQATVTVTEALDQAFEQHADSTFDQIELNEDDGSLHWEIDLDGDNNTDIELDVSATS